MHPTKIQIILRIRTVWSDFIGQIMVSQGCIDSYCRQWRLWSDCIDVQADLSLRCEHISEGTFSHVTNRLFTWAQLFKTNDIVSLRIVNDH